MFFFQGLLTRPILSRAARLVLLFFVLLGSPLYGKDRLRVAVAGFDGTSDFLVLIAQGAKLFEKQGLNVEVIAITGAAPSTSALSRGEIDFDVRAPVSAIQTKLKGLDPIFLASALNYLDYTIITRPDIANVQDLKGKRVGIVRFGGITDLLARYLFRSAGLEPVREFALLQVGPPAARISALQAKVIDATILPPSQEYSAIKAGLKTLDIPSVPFLSGVVVAREAFVKSERSTVSRFLRAYVEAIHFFFTRKEETLNIMSRVYRSQDRGWVEHLYKNHQQHQIGRKPFPNWDGVKATLDVMASDTPAVKQIQPKQLFDLSVLDELDKSGFVDNLYKR